MKFILFCFLFGFPIAAAAQTKGYDLDAWFWHDHLSTRDSLYTQDYDISSRSDEIPVHLPISDFEYIDSVATSVGFWGWPDTIYNVPDTVRKNGKIELEDFLIAPGAGRVSFRFHTPMHDKSIEILNWHRAAYLNEKIMKLEDAISMVLKRQPYYNTLPRPMMRE